MKQRKVIINKACVTLNGDRFPGDEYVGEDGAHLVDAGLAEYEALTVPDPDDQETAGAPGEGEESDGQPVGDQTAGSDDGASDPDDQETAGSRAFCHVEGCRKYKTTPCPECESPTCEDHMDAEAGMCVMCVTEAGGLDPEESGV